MMTTNDLLLLADQALQQTDEPGWSPDTFLNKAVIQASEEEGNVKDCVKEGDIKQHSEAGVRKVKKGDRGSMEGGIEWHPLIPFLPAETRVLFLGSFPPQRKRWCMDFFYPNFINDHWRIEGLVFFSDAQHFVDSPLKKFLLPEIVAHLKRHGIGFFDTSLAVRRLSDNASDKDLEVVVPTDILTLTSHLPHLRAIVTTGEKATETIMDALGVHDAHGRPLIPKVNSTFLSHIRDIELCRLPSSSRAYPLALAKKAEAYELMFQRYLNLA